MSIASLTQLSDACCPKTHYKKDVSSLNRMHSTAVTGWRTYLEKPSAGRGSYSLALWASWKGRPAIRVAWLYWAMARSACCWAAACLTAAASALAALLSCSACCARLFSSATSACCTSYTSVRSCKAIGYCMTSIAQQKAVSAAAIKSVGPRWFLK